MCWRREYRIVGEEVEARNIDVHGFSHCVYSQTGIRGGEGLWYPYKGYWKYHRGLVFPPERMEEIVAIGDNLEALLPLEGTFTFNGKVIPHERRETMTLREWLACMEVTDFSNNFVG